MPFCSLVRAQQPVTPIGELFAADGNAQLAQAAGSGMSVVPGSEVSAGIAAARLRLYRGGQLRICPRTSLSVNSGPLGLMFALGRGAIEIDYTLPVPASQAGSVSEVEPGSGRRWDLLITPDFSLRLAGPGRFHFAFASNKQGDTCVKTLPGNSEPIDVSEALSSASYRIRPQESVRFHDFKLAGNAELQPNEACGCPEAPPVMQAAARAPVNPQEQSQRSGSMSANTNQTDASLPQQRSGQVHVQVETPFVFSAKDAAGPKPYSVARLTFSSLPNLYFVQETVDPVVLVQNERGVSVPDQVPPQVVATPDDKPSQKKEKKGFFGKLKSLLGSLFRH